MDPFFLQQLFLAKLEEARLYSELLENHLVSSKGMDDSKQDKELEKWLVKAADWQTQTTALRALTSRFDLQLPPGKPSVKSQKTSADKAPLPIPVSRFEGIEIQRQVVNKKGPLFSAGYHTAKQVLEVEFKPGSLYRYFDVPEELYLEMLENPRQAMSFFTRNIRNNYEFKQINL